VHGPGESHFRLLAAFLDPGLLAATWAAAGAAGLATHEQGDATLVLPSR
jgi:S-adenosylmethionine:tRNA ribosyltransferase-isomerase